MDNPLVIALLLGLLSASSLPLGALLGVYWRPGDRPMAFFLALSSSAIFPRRYPAPPACARKASAPGASWPCGLG